MKGHWIEQVIGWSHIAFHPLKQSLVLEHCGWKKQRGDRAPCNH